MNYSPFLNLIPLLLFHLLRCAAAASAAAPLHFQFHFPSFSPRNITLLGDSYLRNGLLGLTRDSTVPSTSSGAAIYNLPVPFLRPLSFSTNFSFSISNLSPASPGDGLAFFLSHRNHTSGSPAGSLGLLDSSRIADNRFVAVEFDTKIDPQFDDPDANHVGLDIDTLISVKTANLGSCGVDLRSGVLITAWIDYENDQKKLRAYVGYRELKPKSPVLEVDLDLSDHLNQFMYLGFSASTEGSTQLHMIRSWSFQTFGVSPFNPSVPHTSVGITSPQVPLPGSSTRSDHTKIRLGLGIGFPALFCCLLVIFGWVSVNKWKGVKKQRSFKADILAGPREYSYKELKLATKGFHSSRILGHGAFGTVYKAFFPTSGTISAVKRSKHSHEGKSEFLAELSIIAGLRHKNLVQLQGWCIEKGELLLVYEFMPNGSLDNVLYPESEGDKNPPPTLPWPCRYNIALGLASVLSYLHQECEQQVIHRDIKASNVMLDASFNTRLSDFGLARLMEHDKSPVSTLTAGTMGYLAPEYLQFGIASEKTDVFSYGVVILEVACGRRSIEKETESQRMVNLVDYVWGLHRQGRIIAAADHRLEGGFVEKEMERLLMVGLSCANPDCSARPGMRRVLQILNNEAEPLDVPRAKPTLVFSCTIPLSIEEIVSDDDKDQCGVDDNGTRTIQDLREIKVDHDSSRASF